jgi:hypothetical protein
MIGSSGKWTMWPETTGTSNCEWMSRCDESHLQHQTDMARRLIGHHETVMQLSLTIYYDTRNHIELTASVNVFTTL